jgi:hypothetical protein
MRFLKSKSKGIKREIGRFASKKTTEIHGAARREKGFVTTNSVFLRALRGEFLKISQSERRNTGKNRIILRLFQNSRIMSG